jgi:hypothetical protein
VIFLLQRTFTSSVHAHAGRTQTNYGRRANSARGIFEALCFTRGVPMSRQRVSKGKVFPKPDEKIIKTLQALEPNCSDESLVTKFKLLFLDDWKKILKHYEDHERLTPEGKSHPMPQPTKYLINKFRKYRVLHAKGEDLNIILEDLNTPKPKFTEELPSNIEQLIAQANNKTSYELRIEAVNKLGKFKCEASIVALQSIVVNDRVYDVRKVAQDRLIRFGCEVQPVQKDKPYIDHEIQEKFLLIKSEVNEASSLERYIKKFKSMFPEDYDIHLYQKKNQFNKWVKNIVENLPKT